MNFIKKIFCRRKQFKPQPKQLRIDGVKTPMTAAPDDSELAAQALLESRLSPTPSLRARGVNGKSAKKNGGKGNYSPPSQGGAGGGSPVHDAAYYQQLSEKIRTAHEQERRMAMRYVAYVEEQLARVKGERLKVQGSGLRVQDSGFKIQDSSNHEPCTMNHEPESIATLERQLYVHQDAVEREGGELLKRWQKCLAECLLLEMRKDNENLNENENG